MKAQRFEAAQSLVEFALILPVILLLTMGGVEMSFAIEHNTTLVTATRQGARVGAELGNGSQLVNGVSTCGGGVTTGSEAVDPEIIGAVEGVLLSQGSATLLSEVREIDIFEATDNGSVKSGLMNVWKPASPGAGPLLPGSSPPLHLDFSPSASPWDASTRCGSATAPSIGVRVVYNYHLITPLSGLTGLFGSGSIILTDQTVMALEPPQQ